MYNYLKIKDVRAVQLPVDSVSDRIAKVWSNDFKVSISEFALSFLEFGVLILYSSLVINFPQKEHQYMMIHTSFVLLGAPISSLKIIVACLERSYEIKRRRN